MNKYERTLSALNSLDASCPYDEWLKIAMAAKSAGIRFKDFNSWSATGYNYENENACKKFWEGLDECGGIKAGTLFYLAQASGWKDPNLRHLGYGVQAKNESITDQVDAAANSRAKMIWDNCLPATGDEEYIVRKHGDPKGLRVYPSTAPTLVIQDQNMAGYLVIPCWSDGNLQTLQFIPPKEGKKLNLNGATFDNGYHIIGEISDVFYLCEGIGQAWAINKATNIAGVVCFGAGRIKLVAKVLREKYPNAKLIIVPDRGKEKQATETAILFHGQWVEMPGDKPANYDANDYLLEFGVSSLAKLLTRTKSPELRYALLSVNDLYASPPMRWIVKGLIPLAGIAALYGPSGSGKSFLLIDLALAISTGEIFWFGRRLSAVPITYVCLEGESGLGKRVKAWFTRNKKALPNTLRFVTQPFNLLTDDVIELANAIISAGQKGGLIILDTLNRAAPGADENSPVDMGKIIKACADLQRLTGGGILVTHHMGKDETKKMRGHSSLPAALDGAIEVTRTASGRQWSVAKSKDDKDGDTFPFELEIIDLGTDSDDDAITSCVIAPCSEHDPTIKRRRMPTGDNQKIVFEALGELFKKSSNWGKGGAPITKACVEYTTALEHAISALPCDTKRQKERTKQAISGLISNGFLKHREGWLWTP